MSSGIPKKRISSKNSTRSKISERKSLEISNGNKKHAYPKGRRSKTVSMESTQISSNDSIKSGKNNQSQRISLIARPEVRTGKRTSISQNNEQSLSKIKKPSQIIRRELFPIDLTIPLNPKISNSDNQRMNSKTKGTSSVSARTEVFNKKSLNFHQKNFENNSNLTIFLNEEQYQSKLKFPSDYRKKSKILLEKENEIGKPMHPQRKKKK